MICTLVFISQVTFTFKTIHNETADQDQGSKLTNVRMISGDDGPSYESLESFLKYFNNVILEEILI